MKLRWSLIVISVVDERQEGQLPHDTAQSREHRLSGLTRRYGMRAPAGPSLALSTVSYVHLVVVRCYTPDRMYTPPLELVA